MTSYIAYPFDSVCARAIARRLRADLQNTGVAADYLIFQQLTSEGPVDLDSLDYFRHGANRGGRHVIFLPSYRSWSAVGGPDEWTLPEWLLLIRPEPEACIAGLAALRKRGGAGMPQETMNGTALLNVRQLFLDALGLSGGRPVDGEPHTVAAGDTSIRTFFGHDGVGPHFGVDPETVSRLLESQDRDDFYYLLSLLSYSYSDQCHELTKIEAKTVGTRSFEALGRQAAAKLVLVAARSLRESLHARRLPATDAPTVQVLVVDDDNTGARGMPSYGRSLGEIVAACFPNASVKIYVWNPMAHDVDVFERLRRYRSLDADPGIEKWTISVRDLDGAQVQDRRISLAELAMSFRYVLVDLLYRADRAVDLRRAGAAAIGRRGHLHGPALIRGFYRSSRDLAAGKRSDHALQVLALSRDDDPVLIQDAIRSGARDYVLKAQLLRLPAVLAKGEQSTGEDEPALHRSFPELYRLPRETQGLLRAVRIPCAKPLHRSVPTPGPRPPSQTETAIASLLRRFPKCDLHVHAGSCMSVEFLVVAAAVGLARGLGRDSAEGAPPQVATKFVAEVAKVVAVFRSLIRCEPKAKHWEWKASPCLPGFARAYPVAPGEKWLTALGQIVREDLAARLQSAEALREKADGWRAYQELRAILHAELGVRDRCSLPEALGRIDELTNLDAAFFGLRFATDLQRNGGERWMVWSKDDLIRIYLLVLAASENYGARLEVDHGQDLLDSFREPMTRSGSEDILPAWLHLHERLFGAAVDDESHSLSCYRKVGWSLPHTKAPLRLTMRRPPQPEDFEEPGLSFEKAPIEYTLSTGLRSANLVGYLEGCEFSGAEHLRHPFLIHLYAQQVVSDLIRKGVFYAELRAAPDGYVDPALGFEFPHVCRCLEEAFSQAQRALFAAYRSQPEADALWLGDVLGESYRWTVVSGLFAGAVDRFLPCKVSLIYVGKRHKPTREMILEAAAAAVMRPSGEDPVRSAKEFSEREFGRCRVVGFDLAGKEVGNPPERFVDEFSRLARLHIPLTVHAGENESASFIENSILSLRARRIGHGLSLVEDRGLMTRVREDRVGIELCPMSNYQTSHFGGPNSSRPYPLRRLLGAGILVSINTDNPIISCTNMVREFFQASYAWGDPGLSLWDALTLVRMGYVMSFLNLPERRAVLEIVGQYLLDLFSEESMVVALRELLQSDSLPAES